MSSKPKKQPITLGPLVINDIGGMCPTQASGTMHGKPFYFRARHGEWTLSVAETEEDCVGASMRFNRPIFFLDGDDETHGQMAEEAVLKILVGGWRQMESLR